MSEIAKSSGNPNMSIWSNDPSIPIGGKMSEELKPCPFCGSKASYGKSDYGEWCNCSKPREPGSYCSLQTHYMLKENWQSRPIEDALSAECDALKAEVIVQSDIAQMYGTRVIDTEAECAALRAKLEQAREALDKAFELLKQVEVLPVSNETQWKCIHGAYVVIESACNNLRQLDE